MHGNPTNPRRGANPVAVGTDPAFMVQLWLNGRWQDYRQCATKKTALLEQERKRRIGIRAQVQKLLERVDQTR